MNAEQAPKSPDEKRAFWQGHIDACEAGGQTQVAYCQAHGLALATCHYRKRRLKVDRKSTNRLRLVRLETPAHQAEANEKKGARRSSAWIRVRYSRFAVEVPPGVDAETLRNVLTVIGCL